MKKVVFTIGCRRLEVDLKDDFATYVTNDLAKNKVNLDRENEITQILQLYLKTLHREFNSEEQIKTLSAQIENAN